MERAVKGVRGYSSGLRQEQSELTRRRVLEAARRLFVANGYAEVTMQDIAREAGVAYQTVYAQFRNKLNLALELCSSELPHVGPTLALVVEAERAGDPETWLRMLGTFARRLYEPCAEILRFMRESGDPTLLARYGDIQTGRMHHLRGLGPQLEQTGRLAAGLTAKQAVELAWMLAGPETFERLVLDQGWSPDEFETWLNAALAGLLLT